MPNVEASKSHLQILISILNPLLQGDNNNPLLGITLTYSFMNSSPDLNHLHKKILLLCFLFLLSQTVLKNNLEFLKHVFKMMFFLLLSVCTYVSWMSEHAQNKSQWQPKKLICHRKKNNKKKLRVNVGFIRPLKPSRWMELFDLLRNSEQILLKTERSMWMEDECKGL